MCITIHSRQYDTRMIWFDSMSRNRNSNFFVVAKNRVREKVCFCAVVEEVKQRKSSILWTPQTFSSRPRFSLCGRKRRLKISRSPAASCRDPPLSEETLLTQHTRAERRRMTWSNLYNYLPSELRQIHPQNNVWRDKYKALILSVDTTNFCFEKDFRSIQVTLEGRFAVNLLMFDCRNTNQCTDGCCVNANQNKLIFGRGTRLNVESSEYGYTCDAESLQVLKCFTDILYIMLQK